MHFQRLLIRNVKLRSIRVIFIAFSLIFLFLLSTFFNILFHFFEFIPIFFEKLNKIHFYFPVNSIVFLLTVIYVRELFLVLEHDKY